MNYTARVNSFDVLKNINVRICRNIMKRTDTEIKDAAKGMINDLIVKRKKLKVSVPRLANMTGITYRSLYYIEQGVNDPTLRTYLALKSNIEELELEAERLPQAS